MKLQKLFLRDKQHDAQNYYKLITSKNISIWEYGYSSVLILACIACFKWRVISVDLISPRGLFFRSPVLNVAMLYWQLTIANSWDAFERFPRTWNVKTLLHFNTICLDTFPWNIYLKNERAIFYLMWPIDSGQDFGITLFQVSTSFWLTKNTQFTSNFPKFIRFPPVYSQTLIGD